jgi:predicted RNA methylase
MNENRSATMVLKRANDIEITIKSAVVNIAAGGNTNSFANGVLTVLQIFATPNTIADALVAMKINDKQRWMAATTIIHRLINIGALVSATGRSFVPDKNLSSFGAAPIHITMLNDRVRTDAFIKGIGEVVKPGDVVIDIGTGSGILAIAAARAGAKMVYAIEVSAIADAAQDAFERAGVADRITLIRGLSTRIELPEKADVLISEIIGNDPFGENILPVFKDAIARLLKPGALVLPGRVKVYGLPINMPVTRLDNLILQQQDLDNWRQWYNIDFSGLKGENDFSQPLWRGRAEKFKNFEMFDEPLLLADVDFETFKNDTISTEVAAVAPGNFNGMLVYFELQLGNTLLSNHPLASPRAVHWLHMVWYLPGAAKLTKGEPYHIGYKFMGRESELYLLK